MGALFEAGGTAADGCGYSVRESGGVKYNVLPGLDSQLPCGAVWDLVCSAYAGVRVPITISWKRGFVGSNQVPFLFGNGALRLIDRLIGWNQNGQFGG